MPTSPTKPILVHNRDLIQSMQMSCEDPLIFQSKLLSIRKFDDKIVNILNTEIPTESFYSKEINPTTRCSQFKTELHSYYDSREEAIRRCVDQARQRAEQLRADTNVSRSTLRAQFANVRYFEQELDIEKIYKAKSLKAVEERCRPYA